MVKQTKFPIWKTIKLTTDIKTADDFRRVLSEKGFKIGIWANGTLNKVRFPVVTEETEINLIAVTEKELGFIKYGYDPHNIEFFVRAKKFGLEKCPAGLAPYLRGQYLDQPNGEWLGIAMDTIMGMDGHRGFFTVGRKGSILWLAGPGTYFNYSGSKNKWVFVSPRK